MDFESNRDFNTVADVTGQGGSGKRRDDRYARSCDACALAISHDGRHARASDELRSTSLHDHSYEIH